MTTIGTVEQVSRTRGLAVMALNEEKFIKLGTYLNPSSFGSDQGIQKIEVDFFATKGRASFERCAAMDENKPSVDVQQIIFGGIVKAPATYPLTS